MTTLADELHTTLRLAQAHKTGPDGRVVPLLDDERELMRLSFYAGAVSHHRCLMEAYAADDVTILTKLRAELDAYFQCETGKATR